MPLPDPKQFFVNCISKDAIVWIVVIAVLIATLVKQSDYSVLVKQLRSETRSLRDAANKAVKHSPKDDLKAVKESLDGIKEQFSSGGFLNDGIGDYGSKAADLYGKALSMRLSAEFAAIEHACLKSKFVAKVNLVATANRHVFRCWDEKSRQCHTPFAYAGPRSKTRHGLSCAAWNTKLDLKLGLQMNHSKCANPNHKAGPWCYVDDPDGQSLWDYCFPPCGDVEECVGKDNNGKVCYEDHWDICKQDNSYFGTLHKTTGNITCKQWDQRVKDHYQNEFGFHIDNQCLYYNDPRSSVGTTAPWCQIDHPTDSSQKTGYCMESCNDKHTNTLSVSYGYADIATPPETDGDLLDFGFG